ncbi:protein translocase subunit SecD [Corynebacterium terpenotabidum]|uniref:Protein translocase subunit SecD n=1 Tax=Corynebacterium terpenotabidum Y-11 TaxID=1200352 RepID=S4XGU0_9CORY|nr:protein translocase subunit SecD [Corynebacterium terpenotabidum]AGP30870.1 preprotein translocase subunit SecD [Corynebacterium terpenotabidum Y-11]
MSSTGAAAARARKWPVRALLLFLALVVVIYSVVFFTGDKKAVPKLGIDLQGGTRVTLVPQGSDPTSSQLDQARQILENRVNGMGVSGAQVVIDGNTLVISVPGEDSAQARSLGQTSQLLFRPVTSGSVPDSDLFETLTDMADRWVEAGIITPEDANTKLSDATTNFAGTEGIDVPDEAPTVTATAPDEPANSIEETDRRNEMVDVLKTDRQSDDANTQNAAALLMTCDADDPLAGADDPAKPLVTCSADGYPMLLDEAPILQGDEDAENPRRLSGDMIDPDSNIFGGLDNQTNQMVVTFGFKQGASTPGSETWAALTEAYLGQQIAITLDSTVLSAPTIQSATPVGQSTQITGDFSEKEAQDLANNLKYGALPLSFTGENGEKGGTAETISASMGEASLKAGLIAGIIGLIIVTLYALAYYRGLGVIALASLITSAVLIYGGLVLLGRWIDYSLDLAGVAGLIIGIGTTADSFVVYFERIKDEIHKGSTFRSAAPRAWKRARTTIITGNVVSIVASLVLYFVAVGNVKGFAFTLGLTTVIDIVIAFLVTAPLVILVSRRDAFANPAVNGLHSAFRAADRRRTRDADAAVETATEMDTEPATETDTGTVTAPATGSAPVTGEEK